MLDFGFYNMDCNVALPEFPDNYFDLAVVDPPYGIKVFAKDNASRSKLATSKAYKEYAGGDQVAPDPEYFAQLKRISKNQIIFGANHFIIDTHVGSASSLIAAHKAGLQFVGFELDREYYKDAAARYERETAQISIFDFLEQKGE